MLESILRGKLLEADRRKLNYFTSVDDFNGIEFATPGYMEIVDLINICTAWISEKNVQIIFIDYLQLIAVDGIIDNDLKIFTICKALKKLSVDLNVPIIITVPLKRSKGFSDLKDLIKVGAIETFADVIIFLNREDNNAQNNERINQEIILSISKNNTGLLDRMRLKAVLHVQKFVELDY